MCGIFITTNISSFDRSMSLLREQSHRGPDHIEMQFVDERLFIGHNRLSIIDLEERSNQPMQYRGNSITYNGEVYNYKEIRADLEKRGYDFLTRSDTEVILASYDCWGVNFVKKLNGMFAFIIYDSSKRVLFGVRDRLGQKPFYYSHDGKNFSAASMGSVVSKNSQSEIGNHAVASYLKWGYVPEPLSIFSKVLKLKAGHTIMVDLDNITEEPKIDKYWDISIDEIGSSNSSFEESKEELKLLLNSSVSNRMISDVPLGVFLSGGIDSSLIAAVAQNLSKDRIRTFSIKFNESNFDESEYAKKVSKELGTLHKEIICTYDEVQDYLYNFSEYFDEPFDDSSAIPSLLLAKHTKNDVTVALTGDAGDENFMGYQRYLKAHKYQSTLSYTPAGLRKNIGSFLEKTNINKLNNFGKWLSKKDLEEFYIYQMTGDSESWMKYNFEEINNNYKLWSSKRINHLEKVALFDLNTYLINDINVKVDQSTMAYSLEARSPLLDHRLVEFAFKLRSDYKIKPRNRESKYILKEVLYDYLPRELFNRKKAGFSIPIKLWFRNELRDYVFDTLSTNSLKNINFINHKVVSNNIQKHMDSKEDHGRMIWRLICLINWMKKNEF